ncbi:MAG: ABC transporter permease subunit [Deltaproteobacteria bacterium]|nr:ABC transporter permease subunit [Deltaproteobacteria bacterium]
MAFAVAVLSFCSTPAAADTLANIKARGTILWGADAEGGAPYVFPDAKHPSQLVGFEVDLMDAIAREMGVRPKHYQNNWDGLIPSLTKGDFDLTPDGIEVTPAREQEVLFSRPFYLYSEQIVVRKGDRRIHTFEDLKEKRVGTLSASAAMDMLQSLGGVDIAIYSGQMEPYEDLALGRLDAVFMDLPIAAYYGRSNPKLEFVGDPVGEGVYAIAMRRGDDALKIEVDRILEFLITNGTIQRIFEKWGIWNDAQQKLQAPPSSQGFTRFQEAKQIALVQFIPTLLRGAGITLVLSCVSMALAVMLGLLLTIMRLYGPSLLGRLATIYVEVYRGTPLLVQLYMLYYGLPNIGISLTPMVAAVLGLGMNYAAYESENYRGGIGAVNKGQMEAALALGMPRMMAVRRIVLPQAVRVTLPAVTNDFIALFKDSSIVSVITMVELTKTYNMLATTTFKYFQLGLITAFLYFAMSYPLSLMSRRLEWKLKGGLR